MAEYKQPECDVTMFDESVLTGVMTNSNGLYEVTTEETCMSV